MDTSQQNPLADIMKKYNYTPPATAGQPQDWYAQVKAKQAEQTATAPSGTRIDTDIQDAGNKIVDQIQGNGEFADQSAIRRGVGATETALGTIPKVVSEALPEPARKALSDIGTGLNQDVSWLADKIGSIPALQKWTQDHPDATAKLIDALGTNASAGNIATDILATGEGVKSVETGVSKVTGMAGDVKDVVAGQMDNLKGKVSTPDQNDLEKLSDQISPKPTAREAKLVTEQGRLYKGKPAGVFSDKTLDRIAASDQNVRSVRTIDELIPDHATMDDPTLVTSLKEKIGGIAEQLKPEMEKVPVNEPTITKMSDDWKAIKAEQLDNEFLPEGANVSKMQAKFEKRLNSVKDGSMQDVWDARQAYDDSIPEGVRTADERSSDLLRAQKDIWSQNRQVFTDAINDTANGLGETSRKAFSQMRELYEAKRGLLSKAKIDLTPEASTVKKVITGTVKRVIPYGIGSHL